MPLTLIGEAVFARALSAAKEERVAAARQLSVGQCAADRRSAPASIDDLRQALYASKIISYAQGYQLLRAAAEKYEWNLNYGGIALVWRGGCIIRSAFLGDIKQAFDRDPKLGNLLLDPFFREAVVGAPGRLAARRRRRRAGRHSGAVPRALRSPISTAIARRGCPPIFCRRSATSSARTPTSASTSRAASSSTRIGPATAATRPRVRTAPERAARGALAADIRRATVRNCDGCHGGRSELRCLHEKNDVRRRLPSLRARGARR